MLPAMRKIALWLALAASLIASPAAYAQVCPAVAALPDSERRVAYSPSSSSGPFSLTFAVLGDGTDYGAWLEVWLNNVRLTPVTDWQLTIPSGTLATACRPITNASITLTTAATGTLQIVGARRPRRTVQFAENQGVSARSLNQVITDIVATERETWDKINDVTGRTIIGLPGETMPPLPAAATRASKFLIFDGSGNPTVTSPGLGTGSVLGPATTSLNAVVIWDSTNGTLTKNGPTPGVSGNCLTSNGTIWQSALCPGGGGVGVSILTHGAICTAGTGDSTAAITAAIAAVPAGGTLYIPACATGQSYTVIGAGGCVFTINKSINIFGDGFGSVIFVDTTVPNTRDIFCIVPTAAISGVSFRNFGISSFAAGGRHAIHLNNAGTGFNTQNVHITDMFISPMEGGVSIKATGDANGGIGYSTIGPNNNLESIGLVSIGDGVTITGNVITSITTANKGIEISAVAGAAGQQIIGNVIAVPNCQLCINSATTPIIRDNEFETPVGLVNGYGFLVDVGITSGISAPQLVNNQYSVLAGTGNPVAVRIRTGNLNTRIADARYVNQTGGQHIQIDAGANDTAIDRNAIFVTNAVVVAPAITDNGTRTGWVQYFADGAVATPSIAFLADRDTGLYRIGANNFGLTANGTKIVDISTGGIGVTGIISASLGAVGSPSFTFVGDANTGMFSPGADQVSLAAGGTQIIGVSTAGVGITGVLTVSTTAAITTSTTTPLVIGGTGVGSDLTYVTTSAAGDGTDFHIWKRGNNGATEIMRAGLGIGAQASGLSINTTTVTDNFVRFGGSVALGSGFIVDRSTGGVGGTSVNFTAGGASSGGANLPGGNVNFLSGVSTGNGTSDIFFYNYPGVAAATADNAIQQALKLQASDGGAIVLGYVKTGTVAVGSLPGCAAGTKGARYFVTDSNTALTAGIGAIVAAGGANNVPVVCDGTNWRIGANDNVPLRLMRKFA